MDGDEQRRPATAGRDMIDGENSGVSVQQPSPESRAAADRILAWPAGASDADRDPGWAALRMRFQRHLLDWLRDADPRALPMLVHVAEASAAALRDPALNALWRLAAGAIECMTYEDGAAATASKRLLASLEAELRRLDREGERGARAALSGDLVAGVLHRVAEAAGGGARIERLRREFSVSPAVGSTRSPEAGGDRTDGAAEAESGPDLRAAAAAPEGATDDGMWSDAHAGTPELVLSEAEISEALALDFEGQDPFAGAYDDALAATEAALAEWRTGESDHGEGLDATVAGFRACAAGARLSGAPGIARTAEAVAECLARETGAARESLAAFARHALEELAAVPESAAPDEQTVERWWREHAGTVAPEWEPAEDGAGAGAAVAEPGRDDRTRQPVDPRDQAAAAGTPDEPDGSAQTEPGGAIGPLAPVPPPEATPAIEQLDDDIGSLDLDHSFERFAQAPDGAGERRRTFLPPAVEPVPVSRGGEESQDIDDGLELIRFDAVAGNAPPTRASSGATGSAPAPEAPAWSGPGTVEELEIDELDWPSGPDAGTGHGGGGSPRGEAAPATEPEGGPPSARPHAVPPATTTVQAPGTGDVEPSAPLPPAERYDIPVEALSLDDLPTVEYEADEAAVAAVQPEAIDDAPDAATIAADAVIAGADRDTPRPSDAAAAAPAPERPDRPSALSGHISRARELLDQLATGVESPELQQEAARELRGLAAVLADPGIPSATRDPVPAAAKALEPGGGAVPARATALVVTASLGARRAIAALLEGAGYRTFGARDGADALGMLTRIRPDVVICDASLPRLGAAEFIDRARERSRRPLAAVLRQDGPGAPEARELPPGVVVIDRDAPDDTLLDAVASLTRAGRD